jgi:hypothetical protein
LLDVIGGPSVNYLDFPNPADGPSPELRRHRLLVAQGFLSVCTGIASIPNFSHPDATLSSERKVICSARAAHCHYQPQHYKKRNTPKTILMSHHAAVSSTPSPSFNAKRRESIGIGPALWSRPNQRKFDQFQAWPTTVARMTNASEIVKLP